MSENGFSEMQAQARPKTIVLTPGASQDDEVQKQEHRNAEINGIKANENAAVCTGTGLICSHEWHGEASRCTKPSSIASTSTTSIKSALKKREFRTPSPKSRSRLLIPSKTDVTSLASSADEAGKSTELHSPYEDFDYIQQFLSTAATRHSASVRFDEDCPLTAGIEVRSDRTETITVHIGYLQLDCSYSLEFSVPARLLLDVSDSDNGAEQSSLSDDDGVKSCNLTHDEILDFLRSWRFERVHGKWTKLVAMQVDTQEDSIKFELEFRAAKEKLVAQRFAISRLCGTDSNPSPIDSNDVKNSIESSSDPTDDKPSTIDGQATEKRQFVNVVLVCRVVPRTKGSAVLRDGVHLLNDAHRLRCDSHHTHAGRDETTAVDKPDTVS